MIKKISIKDLRPGMVVATMKSDIWLHSPTLYTTPGVVESEEEVRRIVDAGYLEAFIELPGEQGEPAGPAAATPGPSAPIGQVCFSSELERARELYASAVLAARELFTSVSKGRPVDMARANTAVAGLERSVGRNPAALNCLARLTSSAAYLYAHSVNTAVLAMFTGSHMGMERQELLHLGLAALLHDLGKTRLPLGVLNRRTRLAPEEQRALESHCVSGLAILDSSDNVPRAVKRAVAEHHERFDGRGYPFGLSGTRISRPGRILSLANVFDGLTGRRPYREPLTPSRALSVMYGMRGKDFAPEDTDRFIKLVGIYPSGSVVRLDDGHVGVVCETDPAHPLEPMVNVLLDRRLCPVPPAMVDLRRESGEAPAIRDVLDPGTVGHDLTALLCQTS